MSVTAERLMVEVQADVRQALRALDQVERRSASTSGRLSKMARGMGLAFGGSAIIGGITKTMSLAMDFDSTMRQIGVQTEQTGGQLSKLSALALKMGKDTVFSAQDAAGAMLELSKGGLTAAQIKAGALQQTLTLAAAGGLELSSAAGYITQGMNTFGLSADKASQITTALAGGANASTASVESMGMALSQAGAGAVNAGMNIQETVAALAAFDNAGIKGSDAGTSLKTMLSSLVPATQKAHTAMTKYGLDFVKRNGDFKNMSQVAQELKEGLGDLSQAERVQAMRTIFGSDATRAATVLMKEGSKGLQGYLKATRDTAKAQDMANSAMEGAKGAWENFKGSVETAAIQLGTKLLPGFTKAANAGADFISEVMTWGPQIEQSLGWTVPIVEKLGDALKGVGSIVQSVGGFFAGLPGPVKEVGAQALVAALVMPKLAFAVTTVATNLRFAGAAAVSYAGSLTTAAGRSAALSAATARMGGMMRNVAGVGGMVALMQGSEKAGTAMGALMTTAGAAALGFSVGGPLGAAIGGGIGLVKSWSDAVNASADKARAGITFNEDYAASFDQVTGAMTRATKAAVYRNLQNGDALTVSRMLGIPDREMVNAAMGDIKTMERVKERVAKLTATRKDLAGPNSDHFFFNKDSAADFIGALKNQGRELDSEQKKLQRQIAATQDWSEALKGVPKNVQTKLEQLGYAPSIRQLGKLVDTYRMTPKEVRTMVKALGVDLTRGQLRDLIKESKTLGDMKPTPKVGANTGEADGKLGNTRRMLASLGVMNPTPTVSVRDNASGTIHALAAELAALNGRTATTYVRTVRTGPGGTSGTPYRSADGGTVPKTGRAYADRHHYLLADGEEVISNRDGQADRWRPLLKAINGNRLAGGGTAGKAAAKAIPKVWGGDIVKEMVGGIREGMKPTHKVFRDLEKVVRRNMSGGREREWVKTLDRREKRLTQVWERHARVTERLTAAQDKLAGLRESKQSFMENTTAGMASQATVLNAGNNAASIAASLGVQVEKVKKFAGMLSKLRKMGYSDSIVRQVAEAGVEGGYQAASALVAASQDQVSAISKSFRTITKTAGDTSQQLGSQMYDSGIRAAQGLVQGLKARRKEVQETIRDMAVAMQSALRKALGIRSPSRVFAKLGAYTGQGMVKGLRGEERNVAKAATRLGVAATYGSTKGLTPAALQGGVRAGSSVSFTFITHNPQAEPQSRTTNKAMAKVATLGLV